LFGGDIFIVIGVALLSRMGKRPPASPTHREHLVEEVAGDIIEKAV